MFFQRLWLSFLNPIREALGMTPIMLVPQNMPYGGHRIAERALSLQAETYDALRQNPRLSRSRKADIKRQVREIPDNIAKLLWKQARLQRLRKSLDGYSENSREIDEMIQAVKSETQNAIVVMEGVPVNLLKLELAGGDRAFERLLGELQDTNQRMRDITDTHQELRQTRY